MNALRLRLKKTEFDAVKFGKKTEVVKPVTNKRIHYLCFARMTRECREKQSACRECFENAKVAIGLALGRGGDQAAVKYGDQVAYFGGKSTGTEKNTRVKARVKAQAFEELLENVRSV